MKDYFYRRAALAICAVIVIAALLATSGCAYTPTPKLLDQYTECSVNCEALAQELDKRAIRAENKQRREIARCKAPNIACYTGDDFWR